MSRPSSREAIGAKAKVRAQLLLLGIVLLAGTAVLAVAGFLSSVDIYLPPGRLQLLTHGKVYFWFVDRWVVCMLRHQALSLSGPSSLTVSSPCCVCVLAGRIVKAVNVMVFSNTQLASMHGR